MVGHIDPSGKHARGKKRRRTNQDMSFNEEDAKGVKQPHNDLLIITLMIE